MADTPVDFISGALAHRRKYGGGKSQLVAKAVGIKPKLFPTVLDLTAGLGKDAFVLASLGCRVTLVERNPAVFKLLNEGYLRALEHAEMEFAKKEPTQHSDIELLAILQRMTLCHRDSLDLLAHTPVTAQVIYLDPMFPERKKSAAVKKDMVLLQSLVGADSDADTLLEKALQTDICRVVVKRPKLAPPLANIFPSLVFRGTSSRFDVYPKKAILSIIP